MAQPPDDPFLQVQSDLLSNLDSARPLFQSYLRIRSTATSASSPELREARTELESVLQDLTADLADLLESVKAVEKDHYRYGLEIEEVQRRRQLVEDVGREVEDMHQELRQTVEAGGKGKGVGPDGLPHPSDFDSEGEEGDGYGEFEQQRQMEIMAEQDEALDGVFKTVGNLRAQADTMGRELEEQAELLDDVDNVADRVGGKLQTGIKKIGYVIKKNEDTYSSCCIALLIVMLIILLVIVIAI
ncbi:t-SNARE [Elsinoe ampelina]|uniref:t-SNARE affecting a late Golgi compartment protein 1 n=1 Tax=Elsinoe ampelina TaxID=302913 RepID=A0A6A6G4X4_9PEZI|nr:t-SNARE [Elsinoe ampelina]